MNARVKKYFDDNLYLTLSTICKNGQPWSSPLFFVHDEKFVYWWSPAMAVHSQNIRREERVFFTLFDSRAPEGKGVGLYVAGVAEELTDGNEIAKAVKLYNQKAKIFILKPELAKAPAPTRLYKASMDEVWESGGGKENGFYIDIRNKL